MSTNPPILPEPVQSELSFLADAEPSKHPAVVYLAGLAAGSRPTMVDSLNIAARVLSSGADALTLDWSEFTYAHMRALRARLVEDYSPATANKILSAVRGVVREAWRLELISGDACQRITDVPSIKAKTLPRSRALSPGEIRKLFAACEADKFPAAGARDGAILALLYGACCR